MAQKIFKVLYKKPSETEWHVVGGHFSTKSDALECANDYGTSGRYETKIKQEKIADRPFRWNRED